MDFNLQMYAFGYKVIMVVAIENVVKGQEVTVDYKRDFGRTDTFKCKCVVNCEKNVGQFILTAKEESDVRNAYEDAKKQMENCGLLPFKSEAADVIKYKKLLQEKCREVAKLNQVITNAAVIESCDNVVIER